MNNLKIRRLISISLCCIILLTMCAIKATAEEPPFNTIFSNSNIGPISDVCVIQNTMYVLSNYGIYSIDMNAKDDPLKKEIDLSLYQSGNLSKKPPLTQYERNLWENGIGYLFALNGALYGLHPYTGQISVKKGSTMSKINTIPENQLYYEDQGEQKIKDVVTVFGQGGYFCIVLKSFTYEKGYSSQLYVWDLSAAEMMPVEIEGLKTAIPGKPDTLVICTAKNNENNENELLWQEYCLSDKKLTDKQIEGPQTTTGVAQNPNSQDIYYVNKSGAVMCIKPNKEEIKGGFLFIQYPSETDRAFFANDSTYIYVGSDILACKISKTGQDIPETKTLKIIGQIDENLVMSYRLQHPNVEVIVQDGLSSFLQLQESIVSRDSSVDMYVLNTTGFLSSVIEKGYADILDSNTKLLELSKQLHPAIKDAVLHDGHLVAFPLNIMPNSWAINESLWNKLELGEYPTTLDELFKGADKWDEEFAKEYPEYRYLEYGLGMSDFIAQIIYQYLLENETDTQPVSFDTSSFRNAIETVLHYKYLFDINSADMNKPLIIPFFQDNGIFYFDDDKVTAYLPPSINSGAPRMCGASMDVIIVNPLSENKELAADFIAFCAKNTDIKTQYVMYQSKTTPIEHPNHKENMERMLNKINDMESKLAEAQGAEKTQLQELIKTQKYIYELNKEEGRWLISPEWIEVQNNIAKHMVVPVKSIFMHSPYSERDDTIMRIIDIFIDNQMKVDDFVAQLNSVARLQFYEDAN